jgi:hypothetical protein
MKLQRNLTMSEREKFARPNINIFDKDIIKICNEGEWITFRYKDQERKKLVFLIKTKRGEEKLLPLNQKTINTLISAFGDETKNWVGKEVRVWIFKSQVGEKFVDVVYLTPPNWRFEKDGFLPPEKSNE